MTRIERSTPYAHFVVAVAAFSGFLFGYHTGIISGALSFLSAAFQLTTGDQEMVVSIILAGALVGAICAGNLTDKIGRKKTILLTTFIFLIGSALIALCSSYAELLLGRFVNGLGIGIISVSAPLYLAEISPPHRRGTCVSLFQLFVAIGILGSFAVNYHFAETANWRWMFGWGIFPALLQMAALFFVPETPPWLFKHKKDQEAIAALSSLRKDNNWKEHVDEMKTSADPHKHGSWKTLFTHKLRFILIVGFILSALQQITGVNTVIYYAPKIFEETGFQSTSTAILATVSIGICNTIATAFSVWFLDKVGRRKFLLIGTGAMAVFLIIVTFAFFTESHLIDIISILSLMAYVASFALGLGPVTWVVLSEIFPLRVRGKAMSVAFVINWTCNYFVAYTFLDLLDHLGGHGTYLLYALICAIGFWFIYRFVPETKGKSLDEIELLVTK